MKGILIVVLAAMLAGCGGGSLIGSVPECTDDWVKEAAIDWHKREGNWRRTWSNNIEDPAAEIVDAYVNQKLRLVAVRETKGGTTGRQCVAELHGPELKSIYGEDYSAFRLVDQGVQAMEGFEYRIFLDDEGNAHVRTSW